MSTAPRVDAAQLLTWLDSHGQDGPAVRCAIYAGLAERIRRGDFTPAEQPRDEWEQLLREWQQQHPDQTLILPAGRRGYAARVSALRRLMAPPGEGTGVQPEGS